MQKVLRGLHSEGALADGLNGLIAKLPVFNNRRNWNLLQGWHLVPPTSKAQFAVREYLLSKSTHKEKGIDIPNYAMPPRHAN
jgi:hypothetical protein